MERKNVVMVGFLMSLMLWNNDGLAQQIHPISPLNHYGNIQGVVQCPPGTPLGGALVYLPGHSFMAKTDANGTFRLYNVLAGTYDLAIEASPEPPFTLRGIRVMHRDVNDLGTIVICATPCTDNGGCHEGYYCAKAEGDCDGEGVCAKRPDVYPEIWAPVCGCDGKTYSNEYEAAGFGVNVAYRGECGTPPVACRNDCDCSQREYCAKAPGDCEGEGICRQKPKDMACPMIYDPVCGCNGKTYGNSCEALIAGVNIAHEGPCMPPIR